jgi:hypothetical protein
MSTLCEVKLLRVLPERRFERVGGGRGIEADVRAPRGLEVRGRLATPCTSSRLQRARRAAAPRDRLREVEQDRARLEDRDRLAAAGRVVVHERGHPVVRADREELGLG